MKFQPFIDGIGRPEQEVLQWVWGAAYGQKFDKHLRPDECLMLNDELEEQMEFGEDAVQEAGNKSWELREKSL